MLIETKHIKWFHAALTGLIKMPGDPYLIRYYLRSVLSRNLHCGDVDECSEDFCL